MSPRRRRVLPEREVLFILPPRPPPFFLRGPFFFFFTYLVANIVVFFCNIVCAIKHRWDPKSSSAPVDQVIPIVVAPSEDKQFDWKGEFLKPDAEKKLGEGVKITLTSPVKYQGREQRTVIEIRCDHELKGNEGEWDGSGLDKYLSKRGENGAEQATPEEQFKKKDGKTALIWEGYKHEGDVDTLILKWGTEVVCEKKEGGDKPKDGDKGKGGDKPKDGGEQESRSWGFFTWLVIL